MSEPHGWGISNLLDAELLSPIQRVIVSDHRPIHPVVAIADREPMGGRRLWDRGTRLLLAMTGLIVLDVAAHGMSSTSWIFPWSLLFVVTTAGILSLAITGMIQFLLTEVHLTALRCELDRRQKGEAWSVEGALALSIYPALSLWLNSSGWTRFASTIHVLTVLSVCLAGNSARQLLMQIQRYSPGFSAPANPTIQQRPRLAKLALLAMLVWNLLPMSAKWRSQLCFVIDQSWQELCRWLMGLVALPEAVDPLAAGVNSLGLMITLVAMSVWMTATAPLAMSVLVHSHLSQQQGQRFARIQELLAGFTWMSLCMGLIGPEIVRSGSSLIALLCLGWFNAAYNLGALEAYLRRMRQFR